MHQDIPYWPFEPYELLSAGLRWTTAIPKTAVFISSKAQHKLGLLRHIPSGVPGNSLALDDSKIIGLAEEVVEVPKGSVVFHHCLTAHWSEPNRSPHPRRGLILMYMSKRVQLTDATKLPKTMNFPLVSKDT